MTSLLDQTNLSFPKFEEGDAGIVLKADGTFQVWNTIKDPLNLTATQMEQGRTLLAFSAALKLPQVMAVLHNVAADPSVFPQVVDVGPMQ